MKIRRWLLLLLVVMVAVFTGCHKETDPLEKIKDLEFTVLSEDNIPKELKTIVEEKKTDVFKVTYQDNGFLYICVGYGQQVSGGFSITVNDLYLTRNAVYIDTTLLGPDPAQEGQKKKSAPSYPYVVVKTEFVDKPVVFN